MTIAALKQTPNYRECVVLGCIDCFYCNTIDLLAGRKPCRYKGKMEYGKFGNCLKRKKVKR
jgi:hypothetical protein